MFRVVQWTRLRSGEVPADVQQRFLKLWSHRTGVLKHEQRESGRLHPAERDEGVASPARSTVGRRVPAAAWAAAVIAFVFAAIGYFWLKRPPEAAPVTAQNAGAGTRPPTTAAVPRSEAQRLLAQAWAIWGKWEDASKGDWALADECCRRAVDLAPDPAAAWEVSSARKSVV